MDSGSRNVEKHDGFVVVTPADDRDAMPIACPICDVVMSTHDDVMSYMRWGCCEWCERMWVAAREQQWIEGRRPDHDVVRRTLESQGIV